MYKHNVKISICLIMALLFSYMPKSIFATNSETIKSDYVLVVNTDVENFSTQKTGNFNFDNSGVSKINTASPITFNEKGVKKDGDKPKSRKRRSLSFRNDAPRNSYKKGDKLKLGNSTYTCIGVGDKSYIWISDDLYQKYEKVSKVNALAGEMIRVYEGKPYNMLNEFANNKIPYSDASNKLSIILEDLGSSYGNYQGERDITAIHINIDSDPAKYKVGSLINRGPLLVHEGHHALFDKIVFENKLSSVKDDMRWINEGIGVATMDYFSGGVDSSNWLSFINNNQSLKNGFSLVSGDIRNETIKDYSLPYLYVRYLSAQMSKGFNPMPFYKLIYTLDDKNPNGSPKSQTQIMDELISKLNVPEMTTFEQSIESFYKAIFVQEKSGIYGFYGDPIVKNAITEYPLYQGTNNTSVDLPATAGIIIRTINGAFTVPKDAGKNIKFIPVNKNNDSLKPETGDGTLSNPYIITNSSELASMGIYPNSHFKLGNNIDLTNKTHLTIKEFNGTLDGAGYEIINLSRPLINNNSGIIKNISITANFDDDFGNIGAVLALYNSGKIYDSSFHGTINATLSSTSYQAMWGTIVGNAKASSIIERCYVDVATTISVPENDSYIGGMVGYGQGKVIDSYVDGSLKIKQDSSANFDLFVGGVYGNARPMQGSALEKSYSTIDIDISNTNVTNNTKQKTGQILGTKSGNRNIFIDSIYGINKLPMVGDKNATEIIENVVSRTDTELKTRDTFKGWKFGSIWKMERGSYPKLMTSNDIKHIEVNIINTDVILGTKPDFFGSSLTIDKYNQINLTEDMVDLSSFKNDTLGKQTVSGSYKSKPFSFDLNVINPKKVENLQFKSTGKTNYVKNEVYSSDGVVLEANLNGSSSLTPIYSGFKHNANENPLQDNKTITYTYANNTVDLNIKVNTKQVKTITTTTAMKFNAYEIGDKLDFTNLEIKPDDNNNLNPNIDENNNTGNNQNDKEVKFQFKYNDGENSDLLNIEQAIAKGAELMFKNNKSYKKWKLDDILTKEQHKQDLYISIDDIYEKIATIEVYPPMLYGNQEVYIPIGKNSSINTNKVEGGSSKSDGVVTNTFFETKLLKGTPPNNITIEDMKPFNNEFLKITDNGVTKPENIVLQYELKDTITGKTINFDLTINIGELRKDTDILSFQIITDNGNGSTYKANISDNQIDLVVPNDADLSKVKIKFILSGGAIIKGFSNTLGGNNIIGIKEYTVTAEDGTTTKVYSLNIIRTNSNKTKLLQGLNTANSLLQNYPPKDNTTNPNNITPNEKYSLQSDFNKLDSIITKANEVYNDDNATQDTVDKEVENLTNGIKTFRDTVKVGSIADKTTLNYELDTANLLKDKYPIIEDNINADTIILGKKFVYRTAHNELISVINEANTVYEDFKSTKNKVDTTTIKLTNAIKTFEGSIQVGDKPLDRTALTETIAQANALKDNYSSKIKPDDTIPSDIFDGITYVLQNNFNTFNSAIDNAKIIEKNNAATEDEINNAITTLQDAISIFNDSIKTGTKVDIDNDNNDNSTDNNNNSSDNSNNNNNNTDNNNSTDNNSNNNNDNSTNDNNVDNNDNLGNDTEVSINMSTLISTISEANSLKSKYTVEPDTTKESDIAKNTKYILESDHNSLISSIATAESVRNSGTESQSTIDSAVGSLQNSINLFNRNVKTGTKYNIDKSRLSSIINEANSLKNKYTVVSDDSINTSMITNTQYILKSDYNLLNNAINTALNILEYNTVSQSDIDNAINKLQEAINIFNKNIKTTDNNLIINDEQLDKVLKDSELQGKVDNDKSKSDKDNIDYKAPKPHLSNEQIPFIKPKDILEPYIVLDEKIPYISGISNNSFAPDDFIKRSDVSSMLHQLISDKTVNNNITFTDLDNDKYYSEAMLLLVSKGIMSGYEDGSIKPNKNITRAEFISMLTRILKVNITPSESFHDVDKNTWYADSVNIAKELGWVSGYNGNIFKPNNNLTRAEAVAIINNAIGRNTDLSINNEYTNNIKMFGDVDPSHWAYKDILAATGI